MRRHDSSAALPVPMTGPRSRSRDWATIRKLIPYLWEYKGRVILAMLCLVGAKLANVGVPIVLKNIVDALTTGQPGQQAQQAQLALIALPVALLVAYGFLRLSTTLFTEL